MDGTSQCIRIEELHSAIPMKPLSKNKSKMKEDIPLQRLLQTLGEAEESEAEAALNYCDKRLGLAERDASCARHPAVMTSPVKFFPRSRLQVAS